MYVSFSDLNHVWFFETFATFVSYFYEILNDMKKHSPISEEQNKLARYAKALGHPMRIYILQYLVENFDRCCYSGDLAEILPIARSTLSQHLAELKDAGLIQGEINPPYIKYCINKENFQEAKELFSEIFKAETIKLITT
jgi:ArsR family transcriptional regulator, arsenate/arsenite/antimonite-responsive transcriptional repressor